MSNEDSKPTTQEQFDAHQARKEASRAYAENMGMGHSMGSSLEATLARISEDVARAAREREAKGKRPGVA